MQFKVNLIKAGSDLKQANSGNIIELYRNYLRVLRAYREDLYKLRGSPKINLQQSSGVARELVEQVRKAARSSVEITTLNRNQTELPLESFTSTSSYAAVDNFNRLKFKGFDNWEVKANSINSQNDGGFDQIAMNEAIETASLLRREAYIADKTTFSGLMTSDSGAEIIDSKG